MPRSMRNVASILTVLVLSPGQAFGWLSANTLPITMMSGRSSTRLNSEAQTFSSIDSSEENDDRSSTNGRPNLTGSLFQARWLEFALTEHKPLGCSVEESLASEPDGATYVFISEVVDGGNAQNAGLKKGDVIVRLSGTFDEVVDVTGLGIDKIKSLVAGRADDSTLNICVARGTDVMERHELALVELCIIGDDAATSDCIDKIYADDDFIVGDVDMVGCDEDDGAECLLDAMWDTWSEVVPSAIDSEEEMKEEEDKPKKKKVAPWSSRSSPSGTYVRDPKTGKMVNIDE
mmetsp:Transcript_9625/g.15933  ORF Transcript_9625/g.15933 Transcript_9625/m.15933 type:complete len:290 (+) Transcript_9625:101-970(+)